MKKVVSFLVLVALFASAICGCSSQPSGIGTEGISLEEFNDLLTGMSLSKVKSVVGGKGTLISESKEEKENGFLYTYVYKFEGELGGYAELEFTKFNSKDILKISLDDPELTSKTQYDLK